MYRQFFVKKLLLCRKEHELVYVLTDGNSHLCFEAFGQKTFGNKKHLSNTCVVEFYGKVVLYVIHCRRRVMRIAYDLLFPQFRLLLMLVQLFRIYNF